MTTQYMRFYVSGTVQGVGFRFFTHRKALQLNLTGYVSNLDDGRVEITACGEPDALSDLLSWLEKGGPTHARVTNVKKEIIPDVSFSRFSIRY